VPERPHAITAARGDHHFPLILVSAPLGPESSGLTNAHTPDRRYASDEVVRGVKSRLGAGAAKKTTTGIAFTSRSRPVEVNRAMPSSANFAASQPNGDEPPPHLIPRSLDVAVVDSTFGAQNSLMQSMRQDGAGDGRYREGGGSRFDETAGPYSAAEITTERDP